VALRLNLTAFCHQNVKELNISFRRLKPAFIPLSEPEFTEFSGFSEYSVNSENFGSYVHKNFPFTTLKKETHNDSTIS